jgi:hypothetical protein
MNEEEARALIDAYLLGEQRDRESVFRKLATWTTDIEAAMPILRAIVMVGSRAADESLMALRLILGGRPVNDEAVASIRKAVTALRQGDASARDRYFAVMKAA